jgi:hypothetical protein
MYIYTPKYSSINVNRCIFSHCEADYGGALFLGSNTPYIYISRIRFENNDGNEYGDDIHVGTSVAVTVAITGPQN